MKKSEKAAFIIATAILDLHLRNLNKMNNGLGIFARGISVEELAQIKHFAKQGVKVRLL